MGLSARSLAIEKLRRRLARLAPRGALAAPERHAFSAPWRDLAPAALTELAGKDWRDGPAAEGYALALAGRRAAQNRGGAVWLTLKAEMRDAGRLYAPGGTVGAADAARLTVCAADGMQALLWAAEEAVRGGRAAVVIDARRPHRLLTLTATRRLTLAAERSGAAAILIRHPCDAAPSSAFQRFRVSTAPSANEPCDPSAPGAARWRVELERSRAGGRGAWVVEWDHATGELYEAPPLFEPRPAAMADRPLPAVGAVA